MTAFLSVLLSLSVSGAVLALFLFALRPLLRGRVSRAWQYYAWLLVAVRLLLPVALPVNAVGTAFSAAAQQLPVLFASSVLTPSPDASGADVSTGADRAHSASADRGAATSANGAHGASAATGANGGTGAQNATPSGAAPEAASADADGALGADANANAGTTGTDAGATAPQTAFSAFGFSGAALVPPVLFAVWAAGAFFLLVRRFAAYARLKRTVLSGARPTPQAELLEAYARACRTLCVTRPPVLLLSPAAHAPMLIGALYPVIVLPSGPLLQSDAYHVLLHELTHHKRRDFFCKWAFELAVCVHWLNPLARLARNAAAEACELACDEAVLRALTPEEHRPYGDTLLRLVRPEAPPAAALALGESALKMKERLASIMSFQSRSRRWTAFSAVLGAALVCGALLLGCSVPSFTSQSAPPATRTGATHKTPGVFETFPPGSLTLKNETLYPLNEGDPFWLNYYYKNGYLFAIGWNADAARYAATRDLKYGSSGCTLSFPERLRASADNTAVLEAARLAYGDILALGWPDEEAHSPRSLVLMELAGPFTESPEQLLARFYEADQFPYFCAIAKDTGTPQAAKAAYARRALADARDDYFSVTSDALPAQERYTIAQNAALEENAAIFSLLMDELTTEQLSELTERAYTGKQISTFSMLMDNLTPEQISAFAERAYTDNRMDFFAMLADEMTPEQRNAFAARAKVDGKTSFGHVLAD